MSKLQSSIRLIDTTLRDGSHAVSHQYSAQNISDICAGLEKGVVYAAEVGHGGGIVAHVVAYIQRAVGTLAHAAFPARKGDAHARGSGERVVGEHRHGAQDCLLKPRQRQRRQRHGTEPAP